jgi:hypothetical protein
MRPLRVVAAEKVRPEPRASLHKQLSVGKVYISAADAFADPRMRAGLGDHIRLDAFLQRSVLPSRALAHKGFLHKVAHADAVVVARGFVRPERAVYERGVFEHKHTKRGWILKINK